MGPLVIPRSGHSISRRGIDADALKVLYRLHRHGKIVYLVGGGVRDLLLGVSPKDFDVVTDAHPGEVKRLFRNCWIVGRRFKLAHVVFGKKVIEVATFRAKSPDSEPDKQPQAPGGADRVKDRGRLLVTRENTFGTPEQDARRRDFTINALFYDISNYSLIDYVGGLSDLEDRVIRTIGEPGIRFQEDPVRMMRAVKFAARLDFRLDPATGKAIRQHAADISLSAPPRVLEEIYRLLGSGRALESMRLLQDTGLLSHLIPEIAAHLKKKGTGEEFWAYLDQLDRLVRAGEEEVGRPLQMATVLYHLVKGRVAGKAGSGDGLGEHVESVLRPIAQRLRITRSDTARIIQIFLAQRRLIQPRGRRFSVASFVRRGYFPSSLQLFLFSVAATGEHQEEVPLWQERVRSIRGEGDNGGGNEADRPAPKKKKRRRRRRSPRRSGAAH